jgi:NADH-quinone oxidoreductase subunit E
VSQATHKPSAEGAPFRLSDAAVAELEELAKRYPTREALALPALWKVQEEHGWISTDAMQWVADFCGVSPVRIYGVVSFYHMYFDFPPGKHVVEVCQTTSCAIMGAERLLTYLHDKLGVGLDEPTPDGRFMIRRVECLGACEHAPVCQIDHRFAFDLTPEKLQQALDDLD